MIEFARVTAHDFGNGRIVPEAMRNRKRYATKPQNCGRIACFAHFYSYAAAFLAQKVAA
jgi:hypothetical protein